MEGTDGATTALTCKRKSEKVLCPQCALGCLSPGSRRLSRSEWPCPTPGATPDSSTLLCPGTLEVASQLQIGLGKSFFSSPFWGHAKLKMLLCGSHRTFLGEEPLCCTQKLQALSLSPPPQARLRFSPHSPLVCAKDLPSGGLPAQFTRLSWVELNPSCPIACCPVSR